ncbi:MAG: hypothetical protein JXB00_09280, partial [Bacteroidales bacterium]|nr:hypothetical protein [Bacteroidales bacterium]
MKNKPKIFIGLAQINRSNKFIKTMKLTLILMIFGLSNILASVSSQSLKLKLSLQNVTLKEAIESIESQTDYKFLYREDLIDIN